MDKTYKVSPGAGPYGARIFIHEDVLEIIHSEMNNRCLWGGADKVFDGWHGFEFSSLDASFGGCVAMLKENGFCEEVRL